MNYFIKIRDGYVISVGSGAEETQITKDRYEEIALVIQNKPKCDSGMGCRLKNDLTWELYVLPAPEENTDPELSAEEALDIIVNGGADNA